MNMLDTLPPSNGSGVSTDPASSGRVIRNPVLGGPVLVALHGGEPSPAAIRAAWFLAERLGVSLRALTVVEPAAVFGPGIDVWPVAAVPIDFGIAGNQTALVRRKLREAIGSDEGWTLESRYGSPVREICRMAKEVNATVIVVDAAPHRGLRREVAGIRALQVLHHAHCPVLSAASNFLALPERVLAAIDFSPASIRAAQAALLLLGERGRLQLLHVVLPLRLEQPFEDRSGALIGGDVGDELRRVSDELRRYATPGVTIETRAVHGLVSDEILRAAHAMAADLVAIGAQGRSFVEKLFVGSVASHVLHLSPISVLASPSPPVAEFLRLKLRMTDTVVSDDRREWREMLDAVSRRNTGRRLTLEVDDPAIGAQMQSSGYVFHGAAYDPGNHRVDIMLGPPSGGAHLTRTIDAVKSVSITASKKGEDLAIDVAHGDGHTLVLFENRPTLEERA